MFEFINTKLLNTLTPIKSQLAKDIHPNFKRIKHHLLSLLELVAKLSLLDNKLLLVEDHDLGICLIMVVLAIQISNYKMETRKEKALC